MKRSLIIHFLVLFASLCFAQNAWINEIHYDNASTDANEFIEVVIENAGDYTLADFKLTLYNGNGGSTYGSQTLDNLTVGSTTDNFTFYYWSHAGIQNGNLDGTEPDGMALDYNGTVIPGQFLSYEGTITASGGPADGMISTDIGVAEDGSTTSGQSLQLGGSGNNYDSFFWQTPLTATPGAINANQLLSSVINPEPSSHVTGFTIGTITSSSIQLKWTGATGDQLPTRYLILGKIGDKAFATVKDSLPVVNDNDWSDSTAAFNITHKDGADSIVISGLNEFTEYSFKIYSYTNSGENIDYKTDGDIPETSGTTTGLILTAISEIRQDMAAFIDLTVKVSGTITYIGSTGFYLQDDSAAWSGIYIYSASATDNFALADTVVIVGVVDEYYGVSEITDLKEWKIVANNAAMPKPLKVSTGDFAQEKYESMLMQVTEAECMSIVGSEWTVDDSSGPCTIDDYLYSFTPTLGAIYTIRGIGNYYDGDSKYKLAPRSEADVELITNAPIITDIGTSTRVPLADEAFVDTVKIKAKAALSAVKLYYIINGEEAEMDSVDMIALPGDSIYYGKIPESAYVDGDAVKYWVYAEDVAGENTDGNHHGFFAGTTSIISFKQWIDNTELLYEDYYVRTTGVATVGDSVFSNTSMNFYIQDEEPAAVNIFKLDDGGSVDIIPGHQYTVTGLITQYGGVIEVMPDAPETDVIDGGEAEMPEPFVLDMATLLSGGEVFEGLLFKIDSVDIVVSGDNDSWPVNNQYNADIMISDDGGASQLILHLDKDTDIPGKSEPDWPQNITGIFGQYDDTAPYTEGYRIVPRSINDFETPPNAIKEIATIIPDKLILYSAYPNPFNPEVTIPFNIPVDMVGAQAKKVMIFNTLGQIVKEYTLSNIKAGLNAVVWNGRSGEGNQVSSGLYFAVLQVNNLRQSTKLLLLK